MLKYLKKHREGTYMGSLNFLTVLSEDGNHNQTKHLYIL